MTMTKAVPVTQEDFEGALLDDERRGELIGNPEKLREFIRGYSAGLLKHDPTITDQLRETMREGLKEFAERNEVPIRRLPASPEAASGGDGMYAHLGLSRTQRRQIAATGKGPGAALAGKWPTLGAFLATLDPRIAKDMSESVGGDGGFLVPEEFRAELMALALETALIRPRARVVPMSSASIKWPAIRDASHATNVFGGVSASWIGEAASLSTVSQPTFNQVQLTARKLTGYTVAANELLADSAISLEALINTLFSDALAYFEDDAFIQGTGAGQPLGLLNGDALVTVAKETGQAAGTLTYQNLIKMYSRMLPQSLGRCVWIAHIDTFPQLAQMALDVGTGGSAVWITNAADGRPTNILGCPVLYTEKAKTLGTAGDLYCCDLSYYLIGDRQSLTVAVSPHVNFTTDEMTWRFVQRVDGRPWILTALTPRQGTNTLSPLVNLATRA